MKAKVTPKPKFKKQGVDFKELKAGDYFLYDDCLLVKVDPEVGDQQAVDVDNGDHYIEMCGEYVLPVDVEIKWKRR